MHKYLTEQLSFATLMVRICEAMTERTSISIRLNSSKQHQAPDCTNPKNNFPIILKKKKRIDCRNYKGEHSHLDTKLYVFFSSSPSQLKYLLHFSLHRVQQLLRLDEFTVFLLKAETHTANSCISGPLAGAADGQLHKASLGLRAASQRRFYDPVAADGSHVSEGRCPSLEQADSLQFSVVYR